MTRGPAWDAAVLVLLLLFAVFGGSVPAALLLLPGGLVLAHSVRKEIAKRDAALETP